MSTGGDACPYSCLHLPKIKSKIITSRDYHHLSTHRPEFNKQNSSFFPLTIIPTYESQKQIQAPTVKYNQVHRNPLAMITISPFKNTTFAKLKSKPTQNTPIFLQLFQSQVGKKHKDHRYPIKLGKPSFHKRQKLKSP